MKFLIALTVVIGIFWYGATNWGWMDWWTKADNGFWYEVQQTFNQDNVEAKRIQNQKKLDNMY